MEKIKIKTKLLIILIGITVITVAFYYRYTKNATSSLIISDVNQIHSSLNRYVEIIVGGDVSFDLKIRKPRVVIRDYPRNILEKIRDKIYYGRQTIIGHRFPEVLLSDWAGEFTWWEKDNSIAFNFTFSDIKKETQYPFNKIGDILKHSDISFVNLETPLAMEDECRVIGYFVSKPEFGMAMKKAGIDVVSVANNHAWDAEERGFLQTLENLEKADIKYTGGGRNINEARKPAIFELKGTKIGFISYTQQFKYGLISVADEKNPGVVPFNLKIVSEDIRYSKNLCDLVFVSLHWDLEDTLEIHPKAKEYAHRIIDLGADGIIGHHSHIPKGIELYKGRPIFYSLGNFIFGSNTTWWGDNILGKIIINNNKVINIEIIPIAGKGEKLYQPEILSGAEAIRLLKQIQVLSSDLNTKIEIIDNRGIIYLRK